MCRELPFWLYGSYAPDFVMGKCNSEILTLSLSSLLAQATTFIPCEASTRTVASPTPIEAPVTKATRPCHRSMSYYLRNIVCIWQYGCFLKPINLYCSVMVASRTQRTYTCKAWMGIIMWCQGPLICQ